MGDIGSDMGITLAAIVAVSLALTQALGGLVMYLTEAVKATGKIPVGWSGMVTIFLGVVLGAALGGLTKSFSDSAYDWYAMLGLGAFAGALMAAGAVKTYKAVGEVNTGATVTVTGPVPLGDTEAEADFTRDPAIQADEADATMTVLAEQPATR